VEGEDAAARVYDGALVIEVAVTGSKMAYKGPKLLYLTVTLWVARSFKDKPKGSNSVEHELSVVKR
jgi:hypothetical protein